MFSTATAPLVFTRHLRKEGRMISNEKEHKPEFVVPFVIGIPKIDIEFGGSPKFEGGIDAFMGEWHDAEGQRTILVRNGSNVIRKNPDLPWYDGDVDCTEYAAELDESTSTLNLKGITMWISSSLDSDERHLEMDASDTGAAYTVKEISGGVITAIEFSGKILTR